MGAPLVLVEPYGELVPGHLHPVLAVVGYAVVLAVGPELVDAPSLVEFQRGVLLDGLPGLAVVGLAALLLALELCLGFSLGVLDAGLGAGGCFLLLALLKLPLVGGLLALELVVALPRLLGLRRATDGGPVVPPFLLAVALGDDEGDAGLLLGRLVRLPLPDDLRPRLDPCRALARHSRSHGIASEVAGTPPGGVFMPRPAPGPVSGPWAGRAAAGCRAPAAGAPGCGAGPAGTAAGSGRAGRGRPRRGRRRFP